MNATSSPKIEFVDLKAQYRALKKTIDTRIQRVLDHGQFIMGPEVAELESKLAGLAGARHCITCASGTEALLIALMSLDIKPGDEVITTPFTFIATAEVIVLLGAKPVYVDIEADTCNIDVRQVEAAITPRTRAVIPVSLYGQPADMDELNAICAQRRIAVVEDAAQSFGALYKGRWSGNLSTIGCISFFPSKPLGCYGDGGAMFTNDDALAQALREIRVHGQSKRYVHTRIGLGGRMDSIQCAVVLGKLERFAWEIEQRARVGARYSQLLAEASPQLQVLALRPDRTSVYAQYTVRLKDRAKVQQALQAAGIPTAVHYPIPIHRQPAYQALHDGRSIPVSEQLANEVMSLPMHADLDAATQDRIVTQLRLASISP
jgi:UDP-2-acetamido-2-deoxy-ribo-hexuluronate aminotransferase